jgi:hypothetical protein
MLMIKALKGLFLVLSVLALPAAALADNLTGQQMILCTAVQVTMCTDDGDCAIEAPWNLNVPQFIEIDLKDKKMSTTKASGENRSTPIRTLERDSGLIFLQGVEMGRAFSFVIVEKTGMASIAVAREGLTVSVFGACTPMPAPTAK